MKSLIGWMALAMVIAGGLWHPAYGETPRRRIAVVVGNNAGRPQDAILQYAQRDATRFAQILRELGGVSGDDLALLLDQDANALRKALSGMEKLAAESGVPSMLVFYYSGHASEAGLHLGPTTIPWSEIRGFLEKSAVDLRIALVDACQSGALTRAKGFQIVPSLKSDELMQRGTAFMVSSESTEVSQESDELGGSFFTHFLVSGLRGAADLNQDGRVTLDEARSYTTQNTLRATGTRAERVQRPLYELELSGHGDIIMTQLSDGAARLAVAKNLQGRLLVTERGSQMVVVDAMKQPGQPLLLALSAGRYTVHLRQSTSVLVSEVTVPWGGSVHLAEEDMVTHSYQSVAQKGGVVEIDRQRIHLSTSVQSGLVNGVDVLPNIRVGYGYALPPFEVGFRVQAGYASFQAVDTSVDNLVFGGGVVVAAEYPLRRVDLRGWLVAEALVWRQAVELSDDIQSLVPGVGAGFGVRIPLYGAVFAELSGEASLYFPNLEEGRGVRAAGGGALGFGMMF